MINGGSIKEPVGPKLALIDCAVVIALYVIAHYLVGTGLIRLNAELAPALIIKSELLMHSSDRM